MYSFTWATPIFGGVLGACHALDIPFAFHALDGPGVELFTGAGEDRAAVADALHGAIVELAGTGSVAWPRYDLRTRPVWTIDVEPCVVLDPDPRLRALYE
jgi:para-nitrobenzyl esterase